MAPEPHASYRTTPADRARGEKPHSDLSCCANGTKPSMTLTCKDRAAQTPMNGSR